MTRDHLLALFDAAWETSCPIVVWQCDEPDAPAALETWATSRSISAIGRCVSPAARGHDVVIDILGPWRSVIRVYVHALCTHDQSN